MTHIQLGDAIYNNWKQAMELLVEECSPKLTDVYQKAINKSIKMIDNGGIWLMHFLDMDRWKHDTSDMDLH